MISLGYIIIFYYTSKHYLTSYSFSI